MRRIAMTLILGALISGVALAQQSGAPKAAAQKAATPKAAAPKAAPKSTAGPSFTDVWAMNDAELRAVGDGPLCEAYAERERRNLANIPGVVAEVQRRRANCTAATRSILGACEPLELVRWEDIPQGAAYYIRNTSRLPISFRINHRGVASSKFEIGGGEEKGFGVATDILTAALGARINREDPTAKTVEFFDCAGFGGFPPAQVVQYGLYGRHKIDGFHPVAAIADFFASARVAQPKERRVRLQEGVNYQVVAACGNGCVNLDIEIVDPAGVSVGVDQAEGNAPRVAFKAAATGAYVVRMTVVECAHRYCEFGMRVLSGP